MEEEDCAKGRTLTHGGVSSPSFSKIAAKTSKEEGRRTENEILMKESMKERICIEWGRRRKISQRKRFLQKGVDVSKTSKKEKKYTLTIFNYIIIRINRGNCGEREDFKEDWAFLAYEWANKWESVRKMLAFQEGDGFGGEQEHYKKMREWIC